MASPAALRRLIRDNEYTGMTSAKCPGFVQCNVVVLSSFAAADFHQFCQLNLKACPLLAMSAPGSPSLPSLPTLGRGIDIRTDVPAYRVSKHGHGQVEEERKDIRELWGDDLVTFTLGCSFSFEEALIEDGLDIRNLSQGVNVPMYRTHHASRPAGVFSGDLVVSMRPFLAPDAIRAIQISKRFPSVCGVHWRSQVFGDPVTLNDLELPVVWACGVTPQVALENAKLPFALTHKPGFMLLTDVPNSKLAVW